MRRTSTRSRPKLVTALAAGLLSCVSAVSASAALLPQDAAVSEVVATPADATSDTLTIEVNGTLRLTQSEIVTLGAHPTIGAPQLLQIPIDGAVLTLDLVPHSVRDPLHYRVLVQGEDGSLVEAAPEPVRTLRGAIREIPGSVAAASLVDDGLYGTILLPGGVQYWFEPLAGRFAGAVAGDYVLYRSSDALGGPGACGNGDAPALPHDDEQFGTGDDAGDIAGGTVCTAQLACDADFEYFTAYGSSVANVQNRINSVINTVNVQYQNQTGITHAITTIIVRSTSSDPYTVNDSGPLLTQFRNEWIANQGAVVRDVAKLFTGRTINGGIIGQAWVIGGICTTSAYCYSWSDCCGSTACATDLAAHELGHLWGASHCACSSPPFTMNPIITCANTFDSGSITSIVAHRNSRACLDCGGSCSTNDGCACATVIGNGSFAFSTTAATTDGPDEPTACNFFSYTQVGADIWYRYAASCTGSVNVDVCTATYDTKVAVYGATCPTSASAIACNDDACGTSGTRSALSFNAIAGQHYLIRLGGYNSLSGSGTLTVNCTPSGPANDACANATNVTNGSHPYSTVNATTDGPDEPTACNFFSYTSVGNDVWFRYTAPACGGTVTAAVCDASYDSKMAVYAGGVCPTSASAIACNDDSDACGAGSLRSQVTFSAVGGSVFLIRIGGYNGITGTGTLTISSSGTSPTISTHPTSQSACAGGSVTFSVVAGGSTPLTYQWRRNAVNIGGATSSSYTINPVVAGSAGSYTVVVTNGCGSVISNAATMSVNTAVSISGHPTGQSVCVGSAASFTVTASGTGPLSYQWQKNAVNIGGANSPSFQIPSVATGDAGSYRCVVSNACGSITSGSATLAVRTPPTIGSHPASQTVCVGDPVSFGVLAAGTAPLLYQWQKNTVDIPGATSATYAINPVVAGSAGNYRCIVINTCGIATSNTAVLTVDPCSCPGERGDANCDGAIDFFDIDPFLTALFSPSAYAATYCGGEICTVDIDCSEAVDFFDIDPLLACLFATCPACP